VSATSINGTTPLLAAVPPWRQPKVDTPLECHLNQVAFLDASTVGRCHLPLCCLQGGVPAVLFPLQMNSPAGLVPCPHNVLQRHFRALRARKSVTLSVGTPIFPYGIAYRRAYGSSTTGLLKKKLWWDPLCDVFYRYRKIARFAAAPHSAHTKNPTLRQSSLLYSRYRS